MNEVRERNYKGIESITLRDEVRGDDDLYIDDASVEYTQQSPNGIKFESLKVSTKNNGIARYLNIKTNEEGFSFSDVDELISILNDFKKRVLL